MISCEDLKGKISVAHSVRYGNYKQYLDNVVQFTDILVSNFAAIKEHINLPDNLRIVFKPIRTFHGKAFPMLGKRYSQYVVEIDVRLSIEVFVETILHELVHIEQFHEKRLKHTRDLKSFKWNNSKPWPEPRNYDEYTNLPWEVEAVTRSQTIAACVKT